LPGVENDRILRAPKGDVTDRASSRTAKPLHPEFGTTSHHVADELADKLLLTRSTPGSGSLGQAGPLLVGQSSPWRGTRETRLSCALGPTPDPNTSTRKPQKHPIDCARPSETRRVRGSIGGTTPQPTPRGGGRRRCRPASPPALPARCDACLSSPRNFRR